MRKALILILGIFLNLGIVQTTIAFDDNDWQFWPRITVEGKLSDKWKIFLDEEFRIGDDIEDLYFHRSDLGLAYNFSPWFCLGLNYWQSYRKKSGQWKEERRPHINLMFSWKLGKFKFEDRNRFENRHQQDKDSYWRYRNRLTLKPSLKLTTYNIQPYIADEFFIDLKEKELNRDRIYTGLKFQLLKNFGVDFYYMLEMNKSLDNWSNTHVLGSKIKVKF